MVRPLDRLIAHASAPDVYDAPGPADLLSLGHELRELRKLVRDQNNILEAVIPLMERAAELESKREYGKSMRSTTHQKRADAAKFLVTKTAEYLA